MAELKNLIVNGVARVNGDLYVSDNIYGTASNAISAAYAPFTNTDRYVNTASFASTGSNGANGVKMTLTRAGADTATVVATIPVASTTAAGVMTGAQVSALNNITAKTASYEASGTLAKNLTAISGNLIASAGLAKTAIQPSATSSWATAATWVAGNSASVIASGALAKTAIQPAATASWKAASDWITANSTSALTNTDRYVNTAAFASTGSAGANGVKMTLTRAGSDTTQVTATIPVVSATAAGVTTGDQFKSWTSGSSWVGANSASFTRVVASASLAKTAIQPSQTASWASAATWVANNSASSHTHSNKAVLDGLTAAQVNSWVTGSNRARAANDGFTVPTSGTLGNQWDQSDSRPLLAGKFYDFSDWYGQDLELELVCDTEEIDQPEIVYGDGVSHKLLMWGGIINIPATEFDFSLTFTTDNGSQIIWSENTADIEAGYLYEFNFVQSIREGNVYGIITKYSES